MNKSPLVCAYEVESLLGQNSFLKKRLEALTAASLPDIDRVYRKRSVQSVLRNVQEFIWTLRRLCRREAPAPLIRDRYVAENAPPPNVGPRIFLDVTASYTGKVTGGIKTASRALALAGSANGTVIPVIVQEEAILRLDLDGPNRRLVADAGDIFVVIDHYWDAFATYPDLLASLRERGVRVGVCIYDLIPLEYPGLIEPDLTKRLRDYLAVANQGADLLFSVSRSSAQEVKAYLSEHGYSDRAVGSFILGVDPPQVEPDARAHVRSLFDAGQRTFLSVGSILPHKGHLIALRAFERLWAEGLEDRFVILGAMWADNPIEAAIRSHPMFATRLFRIDDASDAEVRWAYENAEALVQPSIAEGFGLPIIEANRCGLPIIASDIAVFREVGCDSLSYFDVADVSMLADRLRTIHKTRVIGQNTLLIDWDHSVTMLREMLIRELA